MLYGSKEGSVAINGVSMPYITFGHGAKPLLLIPGLIDGLRTVRGQAASLAFAYRIFAKAFRVYMFNRPDVLEAGHTNRDMATDLKTAMDSLGIEKACVLGVSQGGMIAQHLAIDHPDVVERLVLAVSAARANDILRRQVNKWVGWAKAGDYKTLITDTLENTYSPKRLRLYRPLYPIICRVGNPKDFGRFLIQSDACLTHDTWDSLGDIRCPTFVVGGDSDRVVGPDASPEMAERIGGSRLLVYKGLGHGAYEEGKDFNRQVLDFLLDGTAEN